MAKKLSGTCDRVIPVSREVPRQANYQLDAKSYLPLDIDKPSTVPLERSNPIARTSRGARIIGTLTGIVLAPRPNVE